MRTLYDYIINIMEGGAGGHMAHPYLTDGVKSGKDLINFFERVADNMDSLEAAVKIDGINVSVRMQNGEFVFDRMDPKDVDGIKKDQLRDRFGDGHGLIKYGGLVLDIFNEGINKCKGELKKLGLLGDNTILFNIEYVDKSTNLISYNKSFLAIHGLLQYEFIGDTQKRKTHEISYDEKTMNTLINKLNDIANKYGFDIVGSVGVNVTGKPNIKKILKQDLTINYLEKTTKSLEDWLLGVKEFNVKPVVTALTREKIGAMSNKAFQYCSDPSIDLSTIFKENQVQNIINCFIIHYATLVLGNEILENVDSIMGKGTDNEGIVIRNQSITHHNGPVKIVGSFMLNIVNSRFIKK